MANKPQDERQSRFPLCFVPLAGALGFSDVFVLAAAAAPSRGFVSALLCERATLLLFSAGQLLPSAHRLACSVAIMELHQGSTDVVVAVLLGFWTFAYNATCVGQVPFPSWLSMAAVFL